MSAQPFCSADAEGVLALGDESGVRRHEADLDVGARALGEEVQDVGDEVRLGHPLVPPVQYPRDRAGERMGRGQDRDAPRLEELSVLRVELDLREPLPVLAQCNNDEIEVLQVVLERLRQSDGRPALTRRNDDVPNRVRAQVVAHDLDHLLGVLLPLRHIEEIDGRLGHEALAVHGLISCTRRKSPHGGNHAASSSPGANGTFSEGR